LFLARDATGNLGYQAPPVPWTNPYADAPRLPEGDALDPRAMVGGGEAPVELEIGPGRGGFIVDRLTAFPDVRMVGLEVRRKWAQIVDERLRERGLGRRGRVFAEDARAALPRLVGGTVHTVFVHFPDPWWKKRHQKRRVATAELLGECARLLVPGGELFFQTDVEDRADGFEALVTTEPRLVPWGDPAAGAGGAEPHSPDIRSARLRKNPYGALSPRERRAVADGLPIVRLRYRRTGGDDPA
jgi:tRNA (guanine-N7-)-methyltransferase